MHKSIRDLMCVGMTLLLSSPVFAQPTQGSNYGPNMWHGGWHSWFVGPVIMIVFIAISVVVVVVLVRWLGGVGHGSAPYSAPGKSPLDILKERFAKGEIDKEEFDERRRVLGE